MSSGAGATRAGERELVTDKADCHTLDAALAFVIALTLDPGLSLESVSPDLLAQFALERPPEDTLLAELEASPPGTTALETKQPAAKASTPAPVQEAPKQDWERTRYHLGAGASLWGSTFPSWLWGGQASFGVDIPGVFPFVLSVRAFGQTSVELDTNGYANVRAYDAALSVCPPLVKWSSLRVAGCLGASLSYLQARGLEFERNRTAQLWDPALVFGLFATVNVWRGFAFAAEALVRVRLTSQRFESADELGTRSTAFEPAGLGLLFSLGPAYEF